MLVNLQPVERVRGIVLNAIYAFCTFSFYIIVRATRMPIAYRGVNCTYYLTYLHYVLHCVLDLLCLCKEALSRSLS